MVRRRGGGRSTVYLGLSLCPSSCLPARTSSAICSSSSSSPLLPACTKRGVAAQEGNTGRRVCGGALSSYSFGASARSLTGTALPCPHPSALPTQIRAKLIRSSVLGHAASVCCVAPAQISSSIKRDPETRGAMHAIHTMSPLEGQTRLRPHTYAYWCMHAWQGPSEDHQCRDGEEGQNPTRKKPQLHRPALRPPRLPKMCMVRSVL
jgi:hypothetical protein